jgi:hypothetical protein
MTTKLRPPIRLRSSDSTLERDLSYTLVDIYARLGSVMDSVTTTVQESFAVGSIYLNITGVNPATELGYGTWTQVAKGMMLVGEL